ncbi:MAG: hypothetical protein CVU97_04825 [Firmicutes bacterium HGW-Firmicutes-21]|nr:MAG: hypothetical protein CVU97_04825 [Firmicutes bacterium HGW-Firmicutes-21]
MRLNIGVNIKRLRCEKNITQEQLAKILNISSAAVSKWEHGDTYPDIAMIFPIAHFFNVSTDDLMGYNADHVSTEIDAIIKQYKGKIIKGKFTEARALISQVRKDYPNDYRIMHHYMWDIASGCADNNASILIKHNAEFSEICECILDGCNDEHIRLEAMTMKSKLLHAIGETEKALDILSDFPSWYQTAGQKSEQLFAKDTNEFRRQLRLNLYELASFAANKMIKVYWYTEERSIQERTSRAEEFGDTLTQLRQKPGNEALCLIEYSAFAELASKLTFSGGAIEDIARCLDKQLVAARACSELAKADDIVGEYLKKNYQTEDFLKWTLDLHFNTEQKHYVYLRENPLYLSILKKYQN